MKRRIIALFALALCSCHDKGIFESGHTLGISNSELNLGTYIYSINESLPAGQGPGPLSFGLSYKYGIQNDVDFKVRLSLSLFEMGIKRNLFNTNDSHFAVAATFNSGLCYGFQGYFGNYPYLSTGMVASQHFSNGFYLTTGLIPYVGVHRNRLNSHITYGFGIGRDRKRLIYGIFGGWHLDIAFCDILYQPSEPDRSFYSMQNSVFSFFSPQISYNLKIYVFRYKNSYNARLVE